MCKCKKCKELNEAIRPWTSKKVLCERCQDLAVARASKEANDIFPHNIDDQRIERVVTLCGNIGVISNLHEANELRGFLANMIKGGK